MKNVGAAISRPRFEEITKKNIMEDKQMKSINPELKQYIETEILPHYDVNNIGGHGKEHIQTVIERSFEIINEFELDVNKDMVYTIAAFHDIGYKENPEEHEEV